VELCTRCGAELDDDGLCGMCLLGGALKTNPTMTPTEGIPRAAPAGTQDALEYDNFGNYHILGVRMFLNQAPVELLRRASGESGQRWGVARTSALAKSRPPLLAKIDPVRL
jgi:hypothetical protein